MKILGVSRSSASIELSLEELGLVLNALWQDLGLQERRAGELEGDLRDSYRALESSIRGVLAEMEQLVTGSSSVEEGGLDDSPDLKPPADLARFADEYFAELRNRDTATHDAVEQHGTDRIDWLTNVIVIFPEHAEHAWPVLLTLVNRAPDDRALADVAAGPLEDIVVYQGARFGDRILAEAKTSARFREALRSVWGVEKLSPSVAREISRLLASQLTPDSTPE